MSDEFSYSYLAGRIEGSLSKIHGWCFPFPNPHEKSCAARIPCGNMPPLSAASGNSRRGASHHFILNITNSARKLSREIARRIYCLSHYTHNITRQLCASRPDRANLSRHRALPDSSRCCFNGHRGAISEALYASSSVETSQKLNETLLKLSIWAECTLKGRAVSTIPVLRCSASVHSAWATRGCAMGSPPPAAQDESDSGRYCSLALALRSALSSWFLAVHLLLPKLVSARRPFAPLPASQICSRPSRAHQLCPAVARRIQEMPKTLWLARGSRTRLNRWPLLYL
jgi:hypothetical protein